MDRAAQLRRHIAILDGQIEALQRKAGAKGLAWAEVEVAMGLLAMADDYRAEMARLEQPGLALVPAGHETRHARVFRHIPA